MKTIIQLLAEELGCKEEYVNNVVTLLDEGNTIPFIARYRKEAHGAMDDTALRTLETRLQYLRNLQQRRDEVKASIEAQGKLTSSRLRSTMPRRSPRSRTSTGRTSRSAARAQPSPRKKASSRWRTRFLRRTGMGKRPRNWRRTS